MKKMTLLLGSLCMIACSKNSEQVDALKANLVKDYGKSQEEADSYTYDARDASAKEVYTAMLNNNIDKANMYADAENLEMVEKATVTTDSILKQQSANKDKKFQAVHAYKLQEKDTVFNVTYFMDGNDIVAVKSKK